MKTKSKKHHYLPRKYLRGFCDDNNLFYVYDKEKDIVFTQSPDTFFLENKLNTIEINGLENVYIEELYCEVENDFWDSYEKIVKTTHKNFIESEDKWNLYLFMLFLFWRLPCNDEIVSNFVEKAFKEQNELDFFKIIDKSGKKVSEKMLFALRSHKDFKKMLRLLLPFHPFHKKTNWLNTPENWQFLYPMDNKNWYFTSDNPIITNKSNYDNLDNLFDDILFPISGKILLVGTRVGKKEQAKEINLYYNIAMIHNAKRFVTFHDEKFLKEVIKLYKIYKGFGLENLIIPKLFNFIENP